MFSQHRLLFAAWLVACCWHFYSCSAGATSAVDDGADPALVSQPGFKLALPDDAPLPGEVVDTTGHINAGTCRTASIQREWVTADGYQAITGLGYTELIGTANLLHTGSRGNRLLAAAVYRLPLGSKPLGYIVVEMNPHLVVDTNADFVGSSSFYIGVADYADNTWCWHGPYGGSYTAVDCSAIAAVSTAGNVHIAIVAFDGSSGEVVSIEAHTKRADLIRPPAVSPIELQSIVGGTYLWWEAVDSENTIGYRVYAATESFTELHPATAELLEDRCLLPPVIHRTPSPQAQWYYSVAAVDFAGNEGPWSPVAVSNPLPGEPIATSFNLYSAGTRLGTERDVEFLGTGYLSNLRFNLDYDADGVFDQLGYDSGYHSFIPDRDARRFVAVGYDVNEPDNMDLATAAISSRSYLAVGPGQDYPRIEDALVAASDGDTILVYPQAGGVPYSQPALFVATPNLTFKGVYAPGADRVVLDGTGFEYSGVGSTPRAIFQFQPGADGCRVEGFELTGAHNASNNGAGIRINQANDVTISDCEIHANDMGLMSNGNGTQDVSRNQIVEFCHVHHNGSFAHPGYNHNFYMGGTSVTIRYCEVNNSLTGHNIKSRARFNQIEWCYVHDSANREFDLVDGAGDTDTSGADSVIKGCLVVKDPDCHGNRGTIHFGQDGGNDHRGTLWVVNNTIVTPYISAVVINSAPGAGANLVNNLLWDTNNNQAGQQLVGVSGGATLNNFGGSHNWLPYGMEISNGTGIEELTCHFAEQGENPPFVGGLAPDITSGYGWQLGAGDVNITGAGKPWNEILLPIGDGQTRDQVPYIYRHALWAAERPVETMTTLGAFPQHP